MITFECDMPSEKSSAKPASKSANLWDIEKQLASMFAFTWEFSSNAQPVPFHQLVPPPESEPLHLAGRSKEGKGLKGLDSGH